jgi:hypothetical protein
MSADPDPLLGPDFLASVPRVLDRAERLARLAEAYERRGWHPAPDPELAELWQVRQDLLRWIGKWWRPLSPKKAVFKDAVGGLVEAAEALNDWGFVPEPASAQDRLDFVTEAVAQAREAADRLGVGGPPGPPGLLGLTNEDWSLLQALYVRRPASVLLVDLAADETVGLTRRTLGPRLHRLERPDLGLVCRPNGPRKGWTITPAGVSALRLAGPLP